MRMLLELDPGFETDAEQLDELTSQLRRALLDLDVESVDRVRRDQAPPGARGVDLIALGTLLVTLAGSEGLLTELVAQVRSWLARSGQRSVRLEIDGDVLEVTGASSSDQARLITTWIERHSST
jgi:Effector Associated Constant Component 1